MGPVKASEAPNRGWMGHSKTSTAGQRSGRGNPLLGRAAFAVTASALAFGVAAWIVGFDPFAALRGPALANSSAALSFDDRFGSRSTISSASIYYPSRRGVPSPRGDFKAEFEQIEGMLTGPSRDTQADQPSPPPASSAVASIPMPRSRPAEADLALRIDPTPQAQADNRDSRTLLQKIADLMPGRLQLASLEPGGGLFSGPRPNLAALGYDGTTAVYDISARVVYMPDGTTFEAHSGLGDLLDDPAHVNARNAGATPPGVYEMKPRERLFHGVPALRMTPVDGSDTFGRSGLLVHSYMLGPNGDSNGCVSVKNYDKFLKAYRDGVVKRLVVVTDLKGSVSASSGPSSRS
jgi:Tlde1 domain